jgi:hypothetical protein
LKSILVVQERNREKAKAEFHDFGFKVVMGTQYLGDFIGEADAQKTWVKVKTKEWADTISELAMVAKCYPQAAYAGLQKSLQREWQFLQRVTDGLGDEFLEIEQRLLTEFLPAFFGVEGVEDTHKLLACLPVKAAGLQTTRRSDQLTITWRGKEVIAS